MSPADITKILTAVPEGEANAKGWRWIWEILDEWSPITIRNNLEILSNKNIVKRKQIEAPGGFAWVYWQEPKAEGAA